MDDTNWLSLINWELERQVLIFVSNEAPDGLYELPSEFARHNLTFPQTIHLTYNILTELLKEGLIVLEEYTSREQKEPRIIEIGNIQEILDNHYNWFPRGKHLYSIGPTKEGNEYLNNLTERDKKRLNERLFG